jgi:hypothetical protein
MVDKTGYQVFLGPKQYFVSSVGLYNSNPVVPQLESA